MKPDLARLRILSGVVIWALHFGAIYGYTAVACARNLPAAVPWVVALATLVGAGACVGVVAVELPKRRGFEAWMTSGLAAVALLAIVWEALPVLMVPPCR